MKTAPMTILASKDRTRIKELYAQLFGAQADNKWATKDIAKRIKGRVASATPDGKGNLVLPAIVRQLELNVGIADELGGHPHDDLPADLIGIADGELPFEASRQETKFSAGPLPPVQSEHFTAQEIADIRARSAADIDKVQRESARGGKSGAKVKRDRDGYLIDPSVKPFRPEHFEMERGGRVHGEESRALRERENNRTRPVKFIGAKKILAGLKAGTKLEHFYRDASKPPCKVDVIAAPSLSGKGGVYSYKHKQYDSLREIAKLDSGQNFNILYFFGLAPWPKHKDRSKKSKEPVK